MKKKLVLPKTARVEALAAEKLEHVMGGGDGQDKKGGGIVPKVIAPD